MKETQALHVKASPIFVKRLYLTHSKELLTPFEFVLVEILYQKNKSVKCRYESLRLLTTANLRLFNISLVCLISLTLVRM